MEALMRMVENGRVDPIPLLRPVSPSRGLAPLLSSAHGVLEVEIAA
jgi:hypothetical protein